MNWVQVQDSASQPHCCKGSSFSLRKTCTRYLSMPEHLQQERSGINTPQIKKHELDIKTRFWDRLLRSMRLVSDFEKSCRNQWVWYEAWLQVLSEMKSSDSRVLDEVFRPTRSITDFQIKTSDSSVKWAWRLRETRQVLYWPWKSMPYRLYLTTVIRMTLTRICKIKEDSQIKAYFVLF